jgi:hypothetical protein
MFQQLEQALGGQTGQQLQDFIKRYRQGAPADGVDPQETADHYERLAPQVPTDVYRQSAEDAFNRLSPDERQQFSEWLRERAAQQGAAVPAQLQPASQTGTPSSSSMAGALAQMHEDQPNLLQQIFGQGGALSNPIARAAVAGITAMAAQRLMNRR